MVLADLITYLKIGSNIILAVLGFISFEDLYQPYANQRDGLIIHPKTVNSVELIPQSELNKLDNIYYANWIYFTQENPGQDK